MTPHARLLALHAAAWSTARLPAAAVACDLSTDLKAPPALAPAQDPAADLDAALLPLVGPGAAWIPAPLGRGAEAIVAAALARPGAPVLATEVYFTGAWALTRCGAALHDLPLRTSGGLPRPPPPEEPRRARRNPLASPALHPSAHDRPALHPSALHRHALHPSALHRPALHPSALHRPALHPSALDRPDLPALAAALRAAPPAAIWISAPRSRLGPAGGAALNLPALAAIAAARDRHAPDAPIVLDATRLGELAARAGPPLALALPALARSANLLVLSGRKDLGGAPLGLVVARAGARVRRADLAAAADLLFGPCPSDPVALTALARGLRGLPERAPARWRDLSDLARRLRAAGVPLRGHGGGALFLDAAAALPALPPGALPAPTLLALLYLAAGVRALGTPVGDPSPPTVRISARGRADWLAAHLPDLLRALRAWRWGLYPAPGPAPTPFQEPLSPRNPAPFAAAPRLSNPPPTAGPAALGAHAGAPLAAAARARLALDNRWLVFPSRRPAARLVEAWLRLAPSAALRAAPPVIAAAAAFWRARPPARTLARSRLGDLTFLNRHDSETMSHESSLTPPRARAYASHPLGPAASTRALDLGPAACWRPGDLHGLDLGWSEALLPGRPGGLLLAPSDHPLAPALAEAALFTAGPPDAGDLDPLALAALAAALRP